MPRYVRKDARVYGHSCCSLCGTGWGGAPGAAAHGARCEESICAACGSVVCHSHGTGNGRCPICHVGFLSGWDGNDAPCRYKRCGKRAVARDGAWPVCAEHLERRCPDRIARCLAVRDRLWRIVE
jgi:hypothetical protein